MNTAVLIMWTITNILLLIVALELREILQRGRPMSRIKWDNCPTCGRPVDDIRREDDDYGTPISRRTIRTVAYLAEPCGHIVEGTVYADGRGELRKP